ncbi:MAG: AmmeMemoRadiSam system protein A [Sphaerochaeta sp.]
MEKVIMDDIEKKTLIELAKNTIAKSLNLPHKEIDASQYTERRGAFVTLSKEGKLRGCIGYIVAVEPLNKQIQRLALEAAYDDPRFTKLQKEEFSKLEIEISVLSVPKIIHSLSEFQLSRDGIILTVGPNRAVFLPQVADETGWNKDEMLSALSRKAGLNPNAYKQSDAQFMTFTAEVFHDM